MSVSYDEALSALYGAPHEAFVAERKKLAAELKSAGDKHGAARLGRLPRPAISVWAVNQLWRRDRASFGALFDAAERVRSGDLGAQKEHRELTARLRAGAQRVLEGGGHAASEATLRRITTTLSALAASGGFDPDPPGALSSDRDPPGFETAEFALTAAPSSKPLASAAKKEAAAAAERRRAEEKARKRAELVRLQDELRTARETVASRAKDVERLRLDLKNAEDALSVVERRVERLEARLAELEA